MTNPQLKRPIWLTSQQREALAEALLLAAQKIPPVLLPDVARQLQDISVSVQGPGRIIQITILGLRLPNDIRPVYMSSEEVQKVAALSHLPEEFIRLLTHESVAHHLTDASVMESDLMPAPKRRGRKPKQR